MKKIITFWFVLITAFSFSQTISTLKMGDIRLGMSLTELSKAVGKELKIKKESNEHPQDLKINHKGINYIVSLIPEYSEVGEKYGVYQISSSDPQLKTLSKVGVGSTLEDLWKAYKNYTLDIYNKWEDKSESYSKTERIFVLSDTDSHTYMTFHMKNSIVTLIEIGMSGG